MAIQHAADAESLTRSPVRIRKVSHVVFEVSDLERSLDFWTRIMGFAVSDTNERGMVFLHNGADHHSIALVEAPGMAQPRENEALRLLHFAFEIDGPEQLLEIRRFLEDNGVPIVFEGRRGPGGNLDLSFVDPDGYVIELNCGMDQIGPDGRSRPASQFRRASSLEEALANPLPESW